MAIQRTNKVRSRHQVPERKFCPKCKAPVWIFLTPYQVAHDMEKCPGTAAGKF